jgi:hypothetical protein
VWGALPPWVNARQMPKSRLYFVRFRGGIS